MKIVVLVKEVPDTYGDRKLNLETGLADREASEAVVDEISERAVELALTYADANKDVQVVALSMGPATAVGSVRKVLAMGAGEAVHVTDDALLGADLGLTAEVLARALAREGFDLVITGNQTTDGTGGVIAAMLAEHLGVPQLTALARVEISPDSVSGTRASDSGTMEVSAPLPAVISITDALPDARFPNFKGIMAAKKKPYRTVTLEQLDMDPEDPGSARSIVIAVAAKPARQAGLKITDSGDAGARLADFLIQNRLV